ncbi:MAG: hypothetical protein IPN03_23010 [Holophagales bacterium]|nr:hypothetical protein [Holophagales bacterium]
MVITRPHEEKRIEEAGALLRGGEEAVAFDAPLVVVAMLEADEGALEIFESVETMEAEELLLEGSDEGLGAAVSLALSHVGRARGDAEEENLRLKADKGAAVVVATGQA